MLAALCCFLVSLVISSLSSGVTTYGTIQVMKAKKNPETDAVFKRKSAVRPSDHL